MACNAYELSADLESSRWYDHIETRRTILGVASRRSVAERTERGTAYAMGRTVMFYSSPCFFLLQLKRDYYIVVYDYK